jgi:hypothetical protein
VWGWSWLITQQPFARSFCYDGVFIQAFTLQSAVLKGLHPSGKCSREHELAVRSADFVLCDLADNHVFHGHAPIEAVMCQLNQRNLFPATGLSCPVWSTLGTAGAARLTVDESWLGFWGCTCSPGFYWVSRFSCTRVRWALTTGRRSSGVRE